MFVYFNKKVSMPGGTRLRSLAWNSQQGWLACGGDNGLLKVLKLPGPGALNENETKKDPFAAAQSNLSMNQTLEGHQGSVLVVRWNENYRKLTSSDDRGLIIVWILHKVANLISVDFTQSSSACLGLWFEEMVNNRSKSVVKDIKWSGDGQKVCIIYEDGQVIVGNVDGNRIWGKDLKTKLANVEWSPDGRLLLFGTKDGKCNIHDYFGNLLSRLHICFDTKGEGSTIMGIDWFSKAEGYDSRTPTLAIALCNGKIQMMRHELDEEPVLIDTKMNITCIKWSPNGEVLGVVGSEKPELLASAENRLSVQLYSHYGIHLRTLHVPGKRISLERLVVSNLEDDSVMQLTYDSMGKFFLERQNWKEAKKFYERSKNNACIAHCLHKLGDWKTLEGLMKSLSKEDPLLLYIANQFWSVGMCKQAVTAFIKHGSTLASIECCLDLNVWNLAFELGQKYDQEALVNDSFNHYIQYLLKCGNNALAVEASETAQQYLLAAKLLKDLANKLANNKVSSQVLKKTYVLMALNIEKWKASARSLKVADGDMEVVVERPWHYAEAYHLWNCVHQHLYLNNFESAFHASIWLNEYGEILDPQHLYSLQAVASYCFKRMGESKRAFSKLVDCKSLSNDIKEKLTMLANVIFHDPSQSNLVSSCEFICKECKSPFQVREKKCPKCETQYHVCVASGGLIMDEEFVLCGLCKHYIKSVHAINRQHCPLCHGDLAVSKATKPTDKSQRKRTLR